MIQSCIFNHSITNISADDGHSFPPKKSIFRVGYNKKRYKFKQMKIVLYFLMPIVSHFWHFVLPLPRMEEIMRPIIYLCFIESYYILLWMMNVRWGRKSPRGLPDLTSQSVGLISINSSSDFTAYALQRDMWFNSDILEQKLAIEVLSYHSSYEEKTSKRCAEIRFNT